MSLRPRLPLALPGAGLPGGILFVRRANGVAPGDCAPTLRSRSCRTAASCASLARRSLRVGTGVLISRRAHSWLADDNSSAPRARGRVGVTRQRAASREQRAEQSRAESGEPATVTLSVSRPSVLNTRAAHSLCGRRPPLCPGAGWARNGTWHKLPCKLPSVVPV